MLTRGFYWRPQGDSNLDVGIVKSVAYSDVWPKRAPRFPLIPRIWPRNWPQEDRLILQPRYSAWTARIMDGRGGGSGDPAFFEISPHITRPWHVVVYSSRRFLGSAQQRRLGKLRGSA